MLSKKKMTSVKLSSPSIPIPLCGFQGTPPTMIPTAFLSSSSLTQTLFPSPCHFLPLYLFPSRALSFSILPQGTAIGRSSSSNCSITARAVHHDSEEAETCCPSLSATKTPAFGQSTVRGGGCESTSPIRRLQRVVATTLGSMKFQLIPRS